MTIIETKAKDKKIDSAKVKNGAIAVIKTGGKQYKVSVGTILNIEKIKGEFKEGDKVVFEKVLLVEDDKGVSIGNPLIEGAKVEAKILEIGRAKKIKVVQYKQKSKYFKNKGHRQPFFKVQIEKIK